MCVAKTLFICFSMLRSAVCQLKIVTRNRHSNVDITCSLYWISRHSLFEVKATQSVHNRIQNFEAIHSWHVFYKRRVPYTWKQTEKRTAVVKQIYWLSTTSPLLDRIGLSVCEQFHCVKHCVSFKKRHSIKLHIDIAFARQRRFSLTEDQNCSSLFVLRTWFIAYQSSLSTAVLWIFFCCFTSSQTRQKLNVWVWSPYQLRAILGFFAAPNEKLLFSTGAHWLWRHQWCWLDCSIVC